MSKSLCNFQINVLAVRATGSQRIYWIFYICPSRPPVHPVSTHCVAMRLTHMDTPTDSCLQILIGFSQRAPQ